MSKARTLTRKIDTMLAHIEQQQEAISDIAERVAAWSRESLNRKMETFMRCDQAGTLEQYAALAQAIDQDITSRKTAAEQRAEQRFLLKHNVSGARDALMSRLQQMHDRDVL